MVTHSEGQFTLWTMEDDVFSMVRLYGPTAIVRILELTKPLGPSLRVNRMWTKRNDECCPKRVVLIIKQIPSSERSLVFSSPTKQNKSIITIFISHGPFAFFYQSTYFASPTAKSIEPCQWIT